MYKNILIPVLLDDDHNPQLSLAAAEKLASQNAEITLINVLEALPAYLTAEIPAEILEKRRDDSKASLEQLAKYLPGAKTALISGHAGGAIVDYATAHNADCIVLNSHKTGMQDFFLGSTAARVVRHAGCTVHVIR